MLTGALSAQDRVEKLVKQLENIKGDEKKVPILLEIARIETSKSNYESAVDYYFKAIDIQERSDAALDLAKSYQELGQLYQRWQGYDKSIEYFSKAEQIYQEENKKDEQSNALEQIAWNYFQIDDNANAKEYYKQQLEVEKANNRSDRVRQILNRLAIVSELSNQHLDAIKYSEEKLTLDKAASDQEAQEKSLNNLGVLYRHVGENKKALNTFKEALKLNQERIKQGTSNNTERARLLTNTGVIYTNARNYNEANNYYQEALRVYEKENKPSQVADMLNRIGANNFLGGNSEKAKIPLLRAVNIAKSQNDLYRLRDSYKILSDVYESEGNLESFGEFNDLYAKTEQAIEKQREAREKDLLDKKFIIEQLESRLRLSLSENERQRLALAQKELLLFAEKQQREIAQSRAEKAEKDRALARARAEQAEQKQLLAMAELKRQTAEKERIKAEAARQKAEAQRAEAEAARQKAEAEKQKAEAEKQKAEADKARREKESLEQEQKRMRQLYLFLAVTAFFVLVISFILFFFYKNRQKNRKLEAQNNKIQEQNASLQQQKEEIEAQRDEIERQRNESDRLLLNILPYQTAQELKQFGNATPKSYEMVTVLFTDFKGFTNIASKLSPREVIRELDHCFMAFDEIIERYGLEKIKTIGDAYMCAGGIPVANDTNPVDAVHVGLEIQKFMEDLAAKKNAEGKQTWQIRLGIHTGPVVAGVIGKKKFAYDIWGDAVNVASRMESSGEVGKVNISGETYELVKEHFLCEYRGKVPAKNKGEVDMYFVTGKK